MQHEEQEKLESPRKKVTSPKTEGDWKPVEIFDGKCDHFYEDVELDPEGHMFASCRKCPMGRLYEPEVYEIVEGKLNAK